MAWLGRHADNMNLLTCQRMGWSLGHRGLSATCSRRHETCDGTCQGAQQEISEIQIRDDVRWFGMSVPLLLDLQKLFYATDTELRRAVEAEERRQARREGRQLKTTLFDAIAQVSECRLQQLHHRCSFL